MKDLTLAPDPGAHPGQAQGVSAKGNRPLCFLKDKANKKTGSRARLKT
jgi:hypothetical protein